MLVSQKKEGKRQISCEFHYKESDKRFFPMPFTGLVLRSLYRVFAGVSVDCCIDKEQ